MYSLFACNNVSILLKGFFFSSSSLLCNKLRMFTLKWEKKEEETERLIVFFPSSYLKYTILERKKERNKNIYKCGKYYYRFAFMRWNVFIFLLFILLHFRYMYYLFKLFLVCVFINIFANIYKIKKFVWLIKEQRFHISLYKVLLK